MRIACLFIVPLACALTAHADFSYTQTTKSSQTMAAGAGDQSSKHYLKGAKMKTERGTTATIIDFDSQTITTLNHAQKTYTVMKFSDIGQAMRNNGSEMTVDVKETGEKKMVNGFNASQVIMTMDIQAQQAGAQGMKMVMEMEMWMSPDVPGASEYRDFFKKYGDRFPWAALGAGGNPSMQKSMADMQRKLVSLGSVPVQQITRVKSAGNNAQMDQMKAGMAQAMAQLEQMKKQGGAQAAAAEQALARMGGMGRAGGSLFETTNESSNFSTAAIPDSVFAIPGDYKQVAR